MNTENVITLNPREKRTELFKQIYRTFDSHQILKRSEDRWVMVPAPNGQCAVHSTIFLVEVIALELGQLYVGGDIEPVIFAHNTNPGEERVHWLGKTTDVSYYVAQKATMGMRSSKHVWSYDGECAQYDLERLAKDYTDSPSLLERIMSIDTYRGLDYVISELMDIGVSDPWEYDIGQVLNTRVVAAHAVLRRLSQLLTEQTDDTI